MWQAVAACGTSRVASRGREGAARGRKKGGPRKREERKIISWVEREFASGYSKSHVDNIVGKRV